MSLYLITDIFTSFIDSSILVNHYQTCKCLLVNLHIPSFSFSVFLLLCSKRHCMGKLHKNTNEWDCCHCLTWALDCSLISVPSCCSCLVSLFLLLLFFLFFYLLITSPFLSGSYSPWTWDSLSSIFPWWQIPCVSGWLQGVFCCGLEHKRLGSPCLLFCQASSSWHHVGSIHC